jgi:putative transposase
MLYLVQDALLDAHIRRGSTSPKAMSRNITIEVGEFYHLYNRGTEKRTIFLDDFDHERFQALLYIANSTLPVHLDHEYRRGSTSPDWYELERGDTLVEICSYVLMPNHFHILAKEKIAGGISRFMQKLLTAYTMYFNTKYERTGSLFQGKFKVTHADHDDYLKYLVSYIHLNPIKRIEPTWKETGIANKNAAERYLSLFIYSSYQDFLGIKRAQNNILAGDALPKYFTSVRDFNREVMDWLSYRD